MKDYDKRKDAELFQKKTQEIIQNYKDKAGINKLKFYTSGSKINKNTVPTWLEEGEEWVNPINGKVWYRKNGVLSAGRKEGYEVPDFKKCPKCERTLESVNDINVRMQTNKCIKCHAKDETEQLATTGQAEVPDWRRDILIKDTQGKIIMNFDEYHKEYGDELAFMFVNNLVNRMEQLKEEGKTINVPMYENAVQKRDNLKQVVKDKIDNVKETVERLQKEGAISDKMSEEDVELVIQELEKAKIDED